MPSLVVGIVVGMTAPARAQAETCLPLVVDGPVFVTATCVDPELRDPYVDVDEERTFFDPATLLTTTYRYVHGGFTDTNARFSFYFPPAATYQGRFFQPTYPTISQEDVDTGTLAFALSNGAYVASTNNGGGVTVSGALGGYRINAAAAKYSRVIAAEMYGEAAEARGYLYGASGGAYQMILLASVMDVQAFPWNADWYRKKARDAFGPALNDNFRLWFMDNADHSPPSGPAGATHVVDYIGELQQALLDLDAWVEHGIRPPASTRYYVDASTQVQVAPTATQRRGVQPVVTLSVGSTSTCTTRLPHRGGSTATGAIRRPACPGSGRSGERTEASVGDAVDFPLEARVPPGAGRIIRVEWDFEGIGDFPIVSQPRDIATVVRMEATHRYSEPGTYFPVVRVTSHRDGRPDAPYGLIQNLARVRVVVRE